MLVLGKDKSPLYEHLPHTFLLIDDEVDVLIPPRRKITVLDFHRHSFNPLKDIDYKKARLLAEIFYSAFPQGENTLTVRNGKRALARLLLNATRLDKLPRGKDDDVLEANAVVDDVLFSPLVRRFLTRSTNFSFDGIVLVRLNRAELGDFDCFILGNLLALEYQGTVVIPDFGFYGHKGHLPLIRQNRLLAGLNYLDETTLKNHFLLGEVIGSRCLFEDAQVLADFKGLTRGTNEYNEDVQRLMGV